MQNTSFSANGTPVSVGNGCGEVDDIADLDMILLRHNGDLFSSCNLSYNSMDDMSKSRDKAFIGNIYEDSLENILESFCK